MFFQYTVMAFDKTISTENMWRPGGESARLYTQSISETNKMFIQQYC